MKNQFKRTILVLIVLAFFSSRPVNAETSSSGYIGPMSKDSSQKASSTSPSSIGLIQSTGADNLQGGIAAVPLPSPNGDLKPVITDPSQSDNPTVSALPGVISSTGTFSFNSFIPKVLSSSNNTVSLHASSDTKPASSKADNSSSTPPKSASTKAAAAQSSGTIGGNGGTGFNVQASSVQIEPYAGAAGLSIPITVPPGRAGIQPNLALVYSSTQRQLGNAGVGWTLDLGSIQISTKNGVPKYDGTDIFTIQQNGTTQDLVADPNTSGLYHMEIEGAFFKIQYFTTYWLMTDKKGTRYYYGNTNDSKQADPANPTRIFRWALNRVEDLQGNYMTIGYLQDNGQIYPQTISYTGNDQSSLILSTYAQVSVSYAAASSPSISYISKFLVKTAKRIDHITVSVGSDVQSTYTFTYHQSANSQRDLLQSVQQIGGDGLSVLPAVTFTYNEALPQWQLASGWNIPSNLALNMTYTGLGLNGNVTIAADAGVRIIDVNGDGYPDFVRNFYGSGGFKCPSCSQPPGVAYNYTYLNNKANGWALTNLWSSPVPLASVGFEIASNAFVLEDTGVRYADFDGNGLDDLIQEYPNGFAGSFYTLTYPNSFFMNNSTGSFNSDSTWSFPNGIYFSTGSLPSGLATPSVPAGVLIGDINGDGLPDLVQSVGGVQGAYINQYLQGSKSFSQNTSFTFPVSPYLDLTQGATVVDLAGDGLSDIIYRKGGVSHVFMNTGTGFVEDTSSGWNAYPQFGDFTSLGTQMIDVNGDGLPDMVITTNGDRANATILLNTGSGWSLYQGKIGDFNFFDYGTQFLDANADGMQGYLTYEYNGSPELYLNANKPVDLLTGVNNGIGAATSIQYDSDFHYQNTYMPYFQPVVKSTTTTVGTQSYTTTYNYAGGLWDTVYREFDGFKTVKVIDPNGNYVTSTYLQDHWLKGRLSEQDTYDSNGNLYTKTVNTWQTQTIATNNASNQISKFLFISRADNYLYDGNNAATPKRTAQEFTYGETPQYGDETQSINDGQVDPVTGVSIDPNKTTTSVTYVNNTGNWIIGLPAQTMTQFTDVFGSTHTISQTSFYYDGDTTGNAAPSLGQLTSKVNWLGSSTQPDPKTTYTYDAYGNLKTTTDPNGNTTTITYDNTVHMFPEQTTNALGQTNTMTYYGIDNVPLNSAGLQGLWGQEQSKTDANNQTAYTIYDALGRPSASVSPLDSVALPTDQKTYNFQPTYVAVTDSARVTSGLAATVKSVSYYDGLGRLIETKSLGPTPGQYIVSGQTEYDNRGLPVKKYLPFFTLNDFNTMDAINTSLPYSQAAYDPMGRIITKTNPDGTYSSVLYNQWTTYTTDENGHTEESFVDAFGRLVKKVEYTGADGRSPYYALTPFSLPYSGAQYSYDHKGNLTTVVDNQGNQTNITYDNLNRKIAMSDPDMGNWQYGYDNNGNLIWQLDAKGQVISFKYDALNRLINKTDAISGPIVNLPNVTPQAATFNVNYNYDDTTQPYGIGRLGSVNYDGGQAGFVYDQLGREINSNKVVNYKNYGVHRHYDDLNGLQQLQYPDGSQVNYIYNQAEQVTGVVDAPTLDETGASTPGINNYIVNVNYNANGQVIQVQYGNGTTTGYTYNPLNLRLTRIYTSNAQAQVLQDLNYTYDSIGQVLTIKDNVNTAANSMTQSFTYDFLNRLISATGPYGSKTYAYDTIGNIIQKDGLTYTYAEVGSRTDGNAAGPHAVSSLSDGTSFKYDLNGNMVSLQKAGNLTQYAYDSQNRLQSVTSGGLKIADYAYDGDGGRIQKTVYHRDLALYNDNTNILLFGSTSNPLPATAQNPTTDTTFYVGNLYESENAGDGSLRTSRFVYLGDTRVAALTGPAVMYYHADHLGSANVLTDSTGLERELTTYDPFGGVFTHEKYGNNFATAWYYFTGKALDDETGLIFLGARYYNPLLGRFITPDTVVQAPQNPQTLNRYTYCNNNPVNLVDPNGHSWWKKFWHSVEKVFGDIVGAIAGVVAGLVTQNFMVGFQVFNLVSSAVNAGISGNWGGFAGQLVGGAIGGALGFNAGLGVGRLLGSLSYTFDGGFLIGATEFGIAGFGAGFGGTLGSGGSFNQALRSGLIGGGIGAVAGGLLEGSYLGGWQSTYHGIGVANLSGEAVTPPLIGSPSAIAGVGTPILNNQTGLQLPGATQYGWLEFLHGTNGANALLISASQELWEGSYVTSPTAIDPATGLAARNLNPSQFVRFTSTDPGDGDFFALDRGPSSSFERLPVDTAGGAPQWLVVGPNKVTSVYANTN